MEGSNEVGIEGSTGDTGDIVGDAGDTDLLLVTGGDDRFDEVLLRMTGGVLDEGLTEGVEEDRFKVISCF